MSLWTPDGEHQVPREPRESTPPPAAESQPAQPVEPGMAGMPDLENMSDEERAQVEAMAAEMAEVRQQMLSVPASVVIANHAMGLYELAAIHLSAEEPKMSEAKEAIDAMTAMVTVLDGRLGENEQTLKEALSQLQMAFVQMSTPPEEA